MLQCTILEHIIDMPDTLKERQKLDWNFICRCNGTTIKVCKKCTTSLYQITKSRIDVIKEKFIDCKKLNDQQRHGKKKDKLTEEVKI